MLLPEQLYRNNCISIDVKAGTTKKVNTSCCFADIMSVDLTNAKLAWDNLYNNIVVSDNENQHLDNYCQYAKQYDQWLGEFSATTCLWQRRSYL